MRRWSTGLLVVWGDPRYLVPGVPPKTHGCEYITKNITVSRGVPYQGKRCDLLSGVSQDWEVFANNSRI